MTFQPGHTLSPGRRHGSRNKRTGEIFNRLENRGDLDPADLLSSIVTNNQEPKELRIQAAGLLMPYKYGKHGSIPTPRYIDDPIQLPEPVTIEQANKWPSHPLSKQIFWPKLCHRNQSAIDNN
jgi:hypothetical protein